MLVFDGLRAFLARRTAINGPEDSKKGSKGLKKRLGPVEKARKHFVRQIKVPNQLNRPKFAFKAAGNAKNASKILGNQPIWLQTGSRDV